MTPKMSTLPIVIYGTFMTLCVVHLNSDQVTNDQKRKKTKNKKYCKSNHAYQLNFYRYVQTAPTNKEHLKNNLFSVFVHTCRLLVCKFLSIDLVSSDTSLLIEVTNDWLLTCLCMYVFVCA